MSITNPEYIANLEKTVATVVDYTDLEVLKAEAIKEFLLLLNGIVRNLIKVKPLVINTPTEIGKVCNWLSNFRKNYVDVYAKHLLLFAELIALYQILSQLFVSRGVELGFNIEPFPDPPELPDTISLNSFESVPSVPEGYINNILITNCGSGYPINPNLTLYPSTWTQSGLNNFDATKINDGNVSNIAFNVNSAGIGSYLQLDLGEGNTKDFTKLIIVVNKSSGIGNFYALWNIEYSDNNIDWVTVYTNLGNSPFIFLAPYGIIKGEWNNPGSHRYWRLYKIDDAVVGDACVEVQFFNSTYQDYSLPYVLIDAPTGENGVQAEATATVIGGLVVDINMTDLGAGYGVNTDSNKYNPYPDVIIYDDSGCWGGATGIVYVPEVLPQITTASFASSFALVKGKVFSWGYNYNYKLGQGKNNTNSVLPAKVTYDTSIDIKYSNNSPVPIRIIGSYDTNFILTDDGCIWGVGRNGYYQLGLNDVDLRWVFNRIDPIYFGYKPVVKLKISNNNGAAGVWALTSDGKLYRWGYNGTGQLGDTTTTYIQVPTELDLGIQIVDISFIGTGGYTGTMLLDINGNVWVSGYQGYSCFSQGDNTNPLTTFVKMKIDSSTYLDKVVQIFGSGSDQYGISYCLSLDGYIYAAGYNAEGELGDNTTTSTSSKAQKYVNRVLKSDLTDFVTDKIWVTMAGSSFIFAREISTQDIYCWGYNAYAGNLGLGDATNRVTATLNTTLNTFRKGAIVKDIQTCSHAGYPESVVLLSDGRMCSCGYNSYGQLGTGDNVSINNWALILLDKKDILKVRWRPHSTSSGLQILTSEGNIYMCGYNVDSELGDGSQYNKFIPSKVLFV